MRLLDELVQGHTLFENRWSESHTPPGAKGSIRTFTFFSRALPAECKATLDGHDEVMVSVIDAGDSASVQVIGTQPASFSYPCTFAIYAQINENKMGFRLNSANLNRMPAGGHLYLEFLAEGSQGKYEIERLISGSISRWVVRRGELNIGSIQLPFYWLEALLVLLFCIAGLVWGIYLILPDLKWNKRKKV